MPRMAALAGLVESAAANEAVKTPARCARLLLSHCSACRRSAMSKINLERKFGR